MFFIEIPLKILLLLEFISAKIVDNINTNIASTINTTAIIANFFFFLGVDAFLNLYVSCFFSSSLISVLFISACG